MNDWMKYLINQLLENKYIFPKVKTQNKINIDRLVQERCNSIANTLELHLPCTKPIYMMNE